MICQLSLEAPKRIVSMMATTAVSPLVEMRLLTILSTMLMSVSGERVSVKDEKDSYARRGPGL